MYRCGLGVYFAKIKRDLQLTPSDETFHGLVEMANSGTYVPFGKSEQDVLTKYFPPGKFVVSTKIWRKTCDMRKKSGAISGGNQDEGLICQDVVGKSHLLFTFEDVSDSDFDNVFWLEGAPVSNATIELCAGQVLGVHYFFFLYYSLSL